MRKLRLKENTKIKSIEKIKRKRQIFSETFKQPLAVCLIMMVIIKMNVTPLKIKNESNST